MVKRWCWIGLTVLVAGCASLTTAPRTCPELLGRVYVYEPSGAVDTIPLVQDTCRHTP